MDSIECPSCGQQTTSRVCENCGMTVLRIAAPYTGGKGFVTTEQVAPTEGTLKDPVGFWVAGQPVPKTGSREPGGLQGWQGRVQQAARMKRLSAGQTGAFQPASIILQFATDESDNIDLLCRSTLDALVHSGILHDDSAVVDLIATRRPVSQSPDGGAGVHVVIAPGEVLHGITRSQLDAVADRAPHERRLVMEVPRTEPDKKGADGSRVADWKNAVKQSFAAVPTPDGPVTMVAEFTRHGHLNVEAVHYPIAGGVDIDKLAKSTRLGLWKGLDVVDLVASKRLGAPPNGLIAIVPGALLSPKVLSGILESYTPYGKWSEVARRP